MNTEAQLRGLGAAGLPGRMADFQALVNECDGYAAPPIDLSKIKPLVGRAVDELGRAHAGGSTYVARDPLSPEFVYGLISTISRGMLPVARAVELARSERAKGTARVPSSVVASATALTREFRARLERNRAGLGRADQALLADQIQAVPVSEQAVAAELLALGFGTGPQRSVALTGLNHWLTDHGSNVPRPGDFLERLPEADRPTFRGLNDASVYGGIGYAGHLVHRMGVPITYDDFTKLAPEARAAWMRDPSFDAKKLLHDSPLLGIPEIVVEMEAKIDAAFAGRPC